jgi:hypothetical protein
LRAVVFEEGLAYTQNNVTELVRWDDVTAFWYDVTHVQQSGRTASTSHVYTVERNDGKKLIFKDTLGNIVKLGETIRDETTRRLLPRAVQALQAGETISFGKIAISKEGISQGKDTVPWDQIENIRLNRGIVAITWKDKRLKWSSIRVRETPNVFVLLAIVNQVVGLDTG